MQSALRGHCPFWHRRIIEWRSVGWQGNGNVLLTTCSPTSNGTYPSTISFKSDLKCLTGYFFISLWILDYWRTFRCPCLHHCLGFHCCFLMSARTVIILLLRKYEIMQSLGCMSDAYLLRTVCLNSELFLLAFSFDSLLTLASCVTVVECLSMLSSIQLRIYAPDSSQRRRVWSLITYLAALPVIALVICFIVI
jgi:hypothetical protein